MRLLITLLLPFTILTPNKVQAGIVGGSQFLTCTYYHASAGHPINMSNQYALKRIIGKTCPKIEYIEPSGRKHELIENIPSPTPPTVTLSDHDGCETTVTAESFFDEL